MAKTSSGVYQLPNGMWGYRYAYMLNGKQKDLKKTKDENGNPFKTEWAALKAREAAIIKEHLEQAQKPKQKRMKVLQVYEEYCLTGRLGKTYGTTRKQDILWNNHIFKSFGSRFIDSISVSLLKMFYLLFGQAYSRNYQPFA